MRTQHSVSWLELRSLVRLLMINILNSGRRYSSVYGVPTGGSVIAVMLADLCNAEVVDKPYPGTLIVDDICASGQTLAKYPENASAVLHVRPGSAHIPTYSVAETEEWIVYPYEHPSGGREVVTRMIEFIGDDPTREGLVDTPDRVIKAWQEVFVGYRGEEPKLATFEAPKCDQMVTLRNIDFVSFCEHHMLPFWGTAHVGYLPNGKVLGLSKLARLVEYRSRRLQIQERLASEIADAIESATGATGVGVVLEATHMCMVARGIKKDQCVMSTSVLRGAIKEQVDTRAEFFTLIGRKV